MREFNRIEAAEMDEDQMVGETYEPMMDKQPTEYEVIQEEARFAES